MTQSSIQDKKACYTSTPFMQALTEVEADDVLELTPKEHKRYRHSHGSSSILPMWVLDSINL